MAPKNTVDRNEVIRKRLAMIYAIVGWNAVIYLFYLSAKDDLSLGGDDSGETILNAAKKMSDNDIEYVQVKGFNVQTTKIDRSATTLPRTIEKE